ncbi:hypothetical protein ACFO4O_04145 [Glaciecola siphonariae]|uniref:Uncharacterized protein n=1 Tax=Glaciecola siphonariae TaxID=521012 RepID=A0ABV9LT67_9ALTE
MNAYTKYVKARQIIIHLTAKLPELKQAAIAEIKNAHAEYPEIFGKEVSNDKPVAISKTETATKPDMPNKPKAGRKPSKKPGKRFNNWTIIKLTENYKALCRCVCGKEKEVFRTDLGKTIGCGCMRKKEFEQKQNGTTSPAKSVQTVKVEMPVQQQPVKPKVRVSEDAKRQAEARRKTEKLKEDIALARELESY